MVDPNLTESTWQRAKADAAGVYKTTTFGVGLAIMELLAVPAAVLATVGQDDTATQVAVPLLSGALALALAFIAVLVVQLAAAPVRQRNELRAAWDPGTPVQPIDIELTLRNELRKASGFYRMQQGSVVATRINRGDAEEWTNRIVSLLTEHVGADAAREFIEAPRNVDQFKPRLDAQTRALDQIINRLGEG